MIDLAGKNLQIWMAKEGDTVRNFGIEPASRIHVWCDIPRDVVCMKEIERKILRH